MRTVECVRIERIPLYENILCKNLRLFIWSSGHSGSKCTRQHNVRSLTL